MKNTDVISKKKIRFLKDALLRYRPERIYLFGSWSRDEEDDLSDIKDYYLSGEHEDIIESDKK